MSRIRFYCNDIAFVEWNFRFVQIIPFTSIFKLHFDIIRGVLCFGKVTEPVACRKFAFRMLTTSSTSHGTVSRILYEIHCVLSGDQVVFFKYLPDSFKGVIQLCLRMRSHQGEPDQRILRSNSRRNNRIDKNTLVEKLPHNEERQIVISDEKRNDRS